MNASQADMLTPFLASEFFITLAKYCFANNGWAVKVRQMTGSEPTQGCPHILQVQNSRLRTRPQAALSRSCPSLCPHRLPIRPTLLTRHKANQIHSLPYDVGQPCGLDSQALSQPLGVGTRRAERPCWTQTPLALPKKENVPQCYLSSGVTALLSDFPSSLGSQKTQM